MGNLIYAIAVVQAMLAAILFTYGYLSQLPPRKVEKPDCIAEVIKSIDRVGQVKSACDKLCPEPPSPAPRRRPYSDTGCDCWRNG